MFRLPTFTQQQVDNAIYEALRVGLVAAGYLPDCVLYNTESDFNAQVAIIKDAGKQVIDLYPIGFQQTLEELTYNSIYIDSADENPGNVSGSSVINLVEQTIGGVKSYNKIHLPDRSTDINYSITVIVNNVSYERIIMAIMDKVFGDRVYLKGVNPDRTLTTNVFFLERQSCVRDLQPEYVERTYQFKAKDLSIVPPINIETVPEMTEFDLGITPDSNDEGITLTTTKT